MTNPTTSSLLRTGAPTSTSPASLLQGGTSSSSAEMSAPGMPPAYLGMTSSGNAAHVTLDLTFSTAMKAGSGMVYVTDGAVQTVIDGATGLPTLRIVGATDTHQVPASSLRYDGNHVFVDAYGLKPGLNYSVIIAPGALASTENKAFAGLRSPGYASFSAPGSDTTGPTLASMELDSSTVRVGHDIEVRLTFSEKIAALDAAAFSTPHAELTGFSSEDGVTWYAWLRATEPGITATGKTITVDMTKIRDLAGNAGSGTVPGIGYDVDTIVTSHVSQVGLYDDAGPYWDDMITNGTSQLIEGAISGRMAEGERFELLLDGTPVNPEDIDLYMASEGSVSGYFWSYLAELSDGTHTLVARVVGGTHSSAEVVRRIVIDNTAPVFTSTADGATEFGLESPVVIKLTEQVFWDRSEGRDDEIEIEDREGNISYCPFSAVERSEDGLTLTIPASVLRLTAGNDYTIRLPSTLTDMAGNDFGSQAIHLHTAGVYVDVMPPRALSAKVVNHAGTYGIGAEIEIRVKFNEPVTLVEGATPKLMLNNGGTANFVAINAANEMVFKYVVASGQDTWELDINDYSSVLGSVADLAGHRLDDEHVEFWVLDNDTAETFGSDIVIVTNGPAPLARPQLDGNSDSGAPGDYITLDRTPTFTGNGALPGGAVFLYDGDTVVASGTADGAGNWSLTPASALADGTHMFNVRHADALGNRSGPSPTYTLQIDSAAAVLAAPALEAASDSHLPGDGVTSDHTPTFSGSGAEAGATVGLYEGGTKLGTGVADASGRWTITTAPLAEGNHAITASQVDIAGNRSADSAPVTVRIDTLAPAATGAPALDAASDSGAAGDQLTSDSTPTLRGSGAEAHAAIELYDGTTLVGSGTADASGNWSVTALSRADGEHTFTVRQVDAAGNRGAASGGTTLRIDTAAASAPGAPLLSPDSDSGVKGDLVTNVSNPTFSGAGAEANATVELYAGVIKLGQTVADASGNWSITSIPRGDGIYTLTTQQVDAAGNRSAASTGVVLKIDTTAGGTLGAPQLHTSSDTGLAGDNFTKINTPTLTGNGAEAGAKVLLYAGTTLLGSGTADASGNWTVTSSVLPDGFNTITAVQVDAAGNQSAPSAATTIRVRTTGGAAVSALQLDLASDSGATGDHVTSDSTPTIKGSGAEANATIELYVGDTKVGTGSADASGNWSVTSVALADGNHAFTAKQVDAADNRSPVSSALAIRIDTSANAAPGEPMLAASSDSGSPGDLVTNDSTPRITGGDAVAGATVRLYSGGVLVATTTADSSGAWAIDIATAFADGTYALTATQVNEAGNASAHSLAASLTIDTSASAPTLALDAASDTGTAGDRLTSVATPTIKGTADAGASVVLYEGATVLGTATADAAGNWSVTSSALTDGLHTLVAKQTDLAGNTSAASAALEVTVDTVAPAKLATPQLATSSDSGTLGDRITNDTTPAITGSGAMPGATIQILNGSGGLTATVTADASGNWSYQFTSVFSNGGYGITAKQMDAAGNLSEASSNVAFQFDTVVATPNITLDFGSDPDGVWDYITRDNTPTFNGTGEAGATVKLYAGTTELGQATVNAFGDWSITSGITVPDGNISFTAIQTDQAGNASSPGGPIPVVIDTTASAPGTPALHADSDDGYSATDRITSITTPTFTGSGVEAGAKVYLYAGADELGYATAGADGSWAITSHSLVEGTYSVTAKQVDKAGNTSTASSALAITIDTSAPTIAFQTTGITSTTDTIVIKFSDVLVPGSVGDLELRRNGTLYKAVELNAAEWSIGHDGDHAYSMLTFTSLVPGAYTVVPDLNHAMNVTGQVTSGLVGGINFEIPPPLW